MDACQGSFLVWLNTCVGQWAVIYIRWNPRK